MAAEVTPDLECDALNTKSERQTDEPVQGMTFRKGTASVLSHNDLFFLLQIILINVCKSVQVTEPTCNNVFLELIGMILQMSFITDTN